MALVAAMAGLATSSLHSECRMRALLCHKTVTIRTRHLAVCCASPLYLPACHVAPRVRPASAFALPSSCPTAPKWAQTHTGRPRAAQRRVAPRERGRRRRSAARDRIVRPSARCPGRREPTWGDLEAVWQTLASAIDRKIRSAEFDPGRRHRDRLPVVTITSGDVRHEAQQALGWRGARDKASAEGKRVTDS